MNWAAVNFDWNQVRAFLATVEEGSLSAAARALGLTQPTLGRQVAALEEELGITLFERSGRSLILTPTGEALAEHVRAMGEAATLVSLVASGQSQRVEGVVKISATEGYSVNLMPHFVRQMRAAAPGIHIEIVATDTLSDLRHREADIAIRNAEPTDADLIARKVRTEAGGLFATPALIAEHGPFARVADLAQAPFVGFGADASVLDALQKRGVPVTAENFVAGSRSHLVHWALCEAGVGIGLHGWNIGRLSGSVVPILEEEVNFEFPVWLVAPQELKTSRRVRVVYDALAAFLKRWPEYIAESGGRAVKSA